MTLIKELIGANGQLLGKIYERGDGTLEIIDRNGQMKGLYYPQRDETIDASGRLVGKGNLLTMIL
jgi:hypothetical protein